MKTSKFLNSKQKRIITKFENLVNEVFVSNNENPKPPKRLKVELMNKVEDILAICKQNLHDDPEDTKDDSTKLPNELWMKILTYLPTKNIFKNFALVNKHFHGLTLDPSAIKYLQIKDVQCHQVGKMEKVLKRCKNLKELSITKNTDDYNDDFVMKAMEITKNLESVKISVVTFISSIDRYRPAINKFFENNHKTLKKIDFETCPRHCECWDSLSLKSLSLCQNLEELSGTFHLHDMKWISQSRSLIKLEIRNGSELKWILGEKINIPNLKYLSINNYRSDENVDYDKLSEQHLPALEKLYIKTEDAYYSKNRATLELEHILDLVENFPKLNTLQFDEEKLPEVNIPNEDLYEIFKDYGILVIFGGVNKVSNIQENFEDFLEHDPPTLEKYKEAKCSYAKWCKINHLFGY